MFMWTPHSFISAEAAEPEEVGIHGFKTCMFYDDAAVLWGHAEVRQYTAAELDANMHLRNRQIHIKI